MQETVLAEGDRLARHLAQVLPATLEGQGRVVLLGRSLCSNLMAALPPTIEQVSRRAGKPLHALLDTDERGRLVLETVNADGEITRRLPVDDLLQGLLFVRGRLHPTLHTHLNDALSGDEHHATRALASALRSTPVLDAMQKLLQSLL